MDNNVSTIAAEPAVAYSQASYADVMDYMHSIHISREDKEKVARRLTVEVTQPALAEAYDSDVASFVKNHATYAFENDTYKRALLNVGEVRGIDVKIMR